MENRRFEGRGVGVSSSLQEVKEEIDEGVETYEKGEQISYNIEEEVPVFDKDGDIADYEYHNSEGVWGSVETKEGSVTKAVISFDKYKDSLEEYSRMIASLRAMNRGKRNHPDVKIYTDPMELYYAVKKDMIGERYSTDIKAISENQEQIDFLSKINDEAKRIAHDVFVDRDNPDIYFEGLKLNSEDLNNIIGELNSPRKIKDKMTVSPIASDEYFQEKLEVGIGKLLYKLSVENNLLPETSDKMEYEYETKSGYKFNLSNSNFKKVGFNGFDGSKNYYSMFVKPGLDKRRNESQ